MGRSIVLTVIAIFIGWPTAGWSQDAQAILQRALELQVERQAGVQSYLVDRSILGNRVVEVYERIEVTAADGTTTATFRLVPPGADDSPLAALSPEDLEEFAGAIEIDSNAVATEIDDGLEAAGLPRNLPFVAGNDTEGSVDSAMTYGMGVFMRNMPTSEDLPGDGSQEAEAEVNDMAAFAAAASLVGNEQVGDRNAFHLRAADLNIVQESDGQDFVIEAVSMWVDSEEYVPLRLKIDGTATTEGESRPLTIERIETDYRTVPNSDMYESYRQTMTLGGMMDADQQAELLEAQEQLAEFEEQLASMSAQERAMMERMMGSQLDMIRNMASGGGFQMETVVNEIRVLSRIP